MSNQRCHVCLGGKVPKLNRPIFAAGRKQLAVRRNRHGQDALLMTAKCARLIAAAKISQVVPLEATQILTCWLRTMPAEQGVRARKVARFQRLLREVHVRSVE